MFSAKKKTQLNGRPTISSPSNFVHRVHTGYDRDDGHLTGLPFQWASLLGDAQDPAGQSPSPGGGVTPSMGSHHPAATASSASLNRSSTLGRPQPFVDPSLITDSQMKPLKVCKFF